MFSQSLRLAIALSVSTPAWLGFLGSMQMPFYFDSPFLRLTRGTVGTSATSASPSCPRSAGSTSSGTCISGRISRCRPMPARLVASVASRCKRPSRRSTPSFRVALSVDTAILMLRTNLRAECLEIYRHSASSRLQTKSDSRGRDRRSGPSRRSELQHWPRSGHTRRVRS